MFFDAFSDVFLGVTCPVCARPSAGVCPSCLPPLTFTRIQPMDPLTASLMRYRPVAACRYSSSLRFILHQVKEGNRHDLVPVLGGLARSAFAQIERPPPDCCAVFVPSRFSNRHRRGLVIAREIAGFLPIPRAGLLRYAKPVNDQAGLSATQRIENMRDAFYARKSEPRTVIIVDDVHTTGASLTAAVSALAVGGHRIHSAVFVATT